MFDFKSYNYNDFKEVRWKSIIFMISRGKFIPSSNSWFILISPFRCFIIKYNLRPLSI